MMLILFFYDFWNKINHKNEQKATKKEKSKA